MIRTDRRPRVAVFDAELAPALAFIRAAAAAGAHVTAFSRFRLAAGRYSRDADEARTDPGQHGSDFVDRLCEEIDSGAIDHVAPTSDTIVFALAEAQDRLSRRLLLPSTDAVRDCLFKPRFADAMAAAGFPTPGSALPTSADDAAAAAAQLGFPLLLKPRSHVGVGWARGLVVRSFDKLVEAFAGFELAAADRAAALAHDPHLMMPMLQRYVEPAETQVVSVTGFLDDDGVAHGVDHCLKLAQWPPRLGVGCLFRSLPPQPFTEQAIAAVRQVLGHGPFELEVLVHQRTGEAWPIDLNPRGFGQMTLSAAAGHDLAAMWVAQIGGRRLPRPRPAGSHERYWMQGLQYQISAVHSLVRDGDRRAALRRYARITWGARVGAVHAWRDPLPGFVSAVAALRNPRSLVRPLWTDAEACGAVEDAGDPGPAAPARQHAYS